MRMRSLRVGGVELEMVDRLASKIDDEEDD